MSPTRLFIGDRVRMEDNVRLIKEKLHQKKYRLKWRKPRVQLRTSMKIRNLIKRANRGRLSVMRSQSRKKWTAATC